MSLEKTNIDCMRQRFSCRKFLEQPIPLEIRQKLGAFITRLPAGPFGGKGSFHLVAADGIYPGVLKNLGTYGFIQGATGFIVGTAHSGENNLEDYGYQMEQIILYATSLDLGTCWLGGSFTRSSFAQKINASGADLIPAVTALGNMIDIERARKSLMRWQIKADKRLPWAKLFFDQAFDIPLNPHRLGEVAQVLEMVRIGPSASNKQPWRVLRDGNAWHFFLQRTRGYRENTLSRFLNIVDVQRLDMGVAMCHFELAARQVGMSGAWMNTQPYIKLPDPLTEYVASWVE